MKVLLRDDVAGVGRRGDIVKVAGGFARNFLLPEGRAIVATRRGVEGQAELMRRGRDLREAQDRSAAEAQVGLLAGAVIPIGARAAGGGRLFGSIGPADVVEAIRAAKGVEDGAAGTSCCPSTSRRPGPSRSPSSCSPTSPRW